MLRNAGLRKSVEQPVLDLNFAASQIGSNAAPDSRIAFSRGSNAYFVDSDGLVKKSPHNLLLRSEDFGTSWTANGDVTVATNEIVAPDGTTTADKISSANFGSGANHVRQQVNLPSGTVNMSVFVKDGGLGTIKLRSITLSPSTLDISSTFTFSSESWTNLNANHTNAFVENYGNGWYRIGFDVNNPATGAAGGVQMRLSAASGNGFIYLWGAQISQHTTLPVDNPYIKTEGSAVYAARLDHDPAWFMSAAQEQNLISYSEELGSNTLTGPNRTISDNAGTDPNGTSTASQVTATGADPYVVITNLPEVGPATFTLSVYLRGDPANTGTDLKLRIQDSGSGLQTSSVQTITSEWQRFEFSATTTGILEEVRLDIPDVADSGDIVFVWGLQLEVGSTASTYHRTEGAPYYGEGATPKGLLIEEARTNLLPYSEAMTASNSFAITALTVTENAALAPDGTLTADNYDNQSGGVTALVTKTITVSASSTNDYYATFFAKKSGTNDSITFNVYYYNNAEDNVVFNLDTETISNAPSDAFMEDYGNGWYRCGYKITRDATGTRTEIGWRFWPQGRGNTSGSMYVWGGSLELGSFPTSYIQTTGSSVTRNADVATMGPTTGGTELVTNGTFDTDASNWFFTAATLSSESGKLRVTSTGGSFAQANQLLSTVVGRRYRLTADVDFGTSASANVQINAESDGSFTAAQAFTADGSASIDFTAQTTTPRVIVHIGASSSAGEYQEFDNVSVRELYPFEQYNPSEGTVLFEANVPAGMRSYGAFFNIADDGSYNDRVTIINKDTNSEVYTQVRSGGTILLNTFGNAISYTLGQNFRVAFAYAASDFASTVDATTVRKATSGAVPSMDSIKIGIDAGNATPGSFHARRVRIFPKRLPDSILQSLTSD